MGHGHVTTNPNGFLARCGGPACCKVCQQERAQIEKHNQARPESSPSKTFITPKHEAFQAIIKALGLEGQSLTSLNLWANPNEAVKVEATSLVTIEGCQGIERVVKSYGLVAAEDAGIEAEYRQWIAQATVRLEQLGDVDLAIRLADHFEIKLVEEDAAKIAEAERQRDPLCVNRNILLARLPQGGV